MGFATTRVTDGGRTTALSGGQPSQDWRTAAIGAYGRARRDQPETASALIAAVSALTGCAPARETIMVDTAGGVAFGVVDGVRFRWGGSGLAIVRPCDHCGCGAFVSPAIGSAEELGFALSAWQALHHDCTPFVADELD